jgi:hypothetical protein
VFELKPHIPLSQWFFYPVFNWDDHLTRRSGYLTSNYRFMARVPKKKCCVKIFHVSGEAENFNASSCSDPSDPRWIFGRSPSSAIGVALPSCDDVGSRRAWGMNIHYQVFFRALISKGVDLVCISLHQFAIFPSGEPLDGLYFALWWPFWCTLGDLEL